MCMSRPTVPETKVAPAPAPVNQSNMGEDLAPTLITADEQDAKNKKKKVKKSGTSALNTSSGVNVATGSGLNVS